MRKPVLFWFLFVSLCFLSGCQPTEKIKVTFDSNGGSAVSPIYTDGKSLVKLPDSPKKADHVFLGWYLDEGTFKIEFNVDSLINHPIDADIIVYAYWQSLYATLKFESNGGTSFDDQRIRIDQSTELPIPEKSGYVFDGWYYDANFDDPVEDETFVILLEDTTVYAMWTSMFKYSQYPEDDYITITGFSERYEHDSETLIIPKWIDDKTVGAIGFNAFDNDTNGINKLVFETGSQVVKIDSQAFKGGCFIDEIILPDTLEFIGVEAFYGCKLTNLTLPSTLKTIGARAFANNRLEKVTFLGDTLIGGIGQSAFAENTMLSDINFPNQIGTLGTQIMYNTAWLNKQGLLRIGSLLLKYNGSDTSLTIPEGIETIALEAFKNNQTLVSIEMPTTLKKIEQSAFYGMSQLRHVYFTSETLPEIQTLAFYETNSKVIPNLVLGVKSHLITTAKATWNNSQFLVHNNYQNIVWGYYTISYVSNDESVSGDNPRSTLLFSGFYITLAENTYSKADSVFDGWAVLSGRIQTLNGKITVFEDTVLYPSWKPNKVNFKLDSMGGTLENEQITVEYGQPISNLETPIKPNNLFVGWYTEVTGGVRVSADEINTYGGEITLYARWQITITLDPIHGILSNNVMIVTYKSVMPSLPQALFNYAYNKGWYTEKGGQGIQVNVNDIVDFEGDVTLYAKWEVPIVFDSQGGNSVPNGRGVYDAPLGELPIPTKTGYIFEGWYINKISSGDAITAEDIVNNTYKIFLYAKWTPMETVVTFNYNGGSGDTEFIKVIYDQVVGTLPIATKENAIFIGWYTETNSLINTSSISKFDKNVTLYAKWEITITFHYDTENSIGMTRNFVVGGLMSGLPSGPTKPYSSFMGWYTELGGKGTLIKSTTINPFTTHTTLYAKWSIELHYDTQGGEPINPKTVIFRDTVGTLSKPTRIGYTFDGWYTEPFGAGSLVTTNYRHVVDTKLVIYANWIANDYTITFDYQGATSNNTLLEKTVAFDFNVDDLPNPIKVTEAQSYSFLGWYTKPNGEGVRVTSDTIYTFSENITLYAHYQHYQMTFTVNTLKIVNGYYPIPASGELTSDYFGATAIDTDGNEHPINVTIRLGNRTAGSTVSIRLTTTDAYGQTHTIDLNNNVRVYGKPTIKNYIKKAYALVETVLDASYFSIFGVDTYNAVLIPTVEIIEGSKTGGQTITVRFTVVDVAGNVTTETLSGIKIYDRIVFEYDTELDALAFDTPITIETFNVKAFDSFDTAMSVSLFSKSIYDNKLTVTFRAWDSLRNTYQVLTIRNIKIFQTPVVQVSGQVNYKVGDQVTLESLGILVKDTFGENITNSAALNLSKENPIAGDTIIATITATDETNNVVTKTISVHFYGSPTITYDQTIKGIKVTDSITNTLFKASGLDSFGNPLQAVISVHEGIQTKSTYMRFEIKVTDIVGNVSIEITDAIGVYDKADLLLSYNPKNSKPVYINGGGLEFQADALDSFNEKPFIFIRIQVGGVNQYSNFVIVAQDLAGNQTVSEQLKNFFVYGDVEFDYQGADAGHDKLAIHYEVNKPYGNLPTPTKTGYTFQGFYTALQGGTLVNNETVRLQSISKLYARWRVNSYTIQFNSNKPDNASNTLLGTMNPITLVYDVSGVLPAKTYTLVGWTFVHWNTKMDGSGLVIDDKATVEKLNPNDQGETVLYAIWRMHTYEIQFNANLGEGEIINNLVCGYEETCTIPDNHFTKIGYNTLGWNTTKTGSGISYNVFDSVSRFTPQNGYILNLYATYSPKTTELHLNQNGGQGGDTVIIATYDSHLPTVTIPSREGYDFMGYYTALEGDELYYTHKGVSTQIWKGLATITLYAKWTTAYEVTLNPNGGTGGTSKIQVNYGKPLPEAIHPTKEGYIFEGYADQNGQLFYNAYMHSVGDWTELEIIELIAQWATVKVNSFQRGSGTKDDPFGIINVNQMLYLVNQTNANKNFTNEKYFVLASDLDLRDQVWVSIGKNEEYAFKGYFDGFNHTILLSSVSTNQDLVGLFGYNTGRIENLTLQLDLTTSKLTVGGIAAINTGHIQNVEVNGKLSMTTTQSETTQNAFVGGITGINYSTIQDSVVNLALVAETTNKFTTLNVGGIVGKSDYLIARLIANINIRVSALYSDDYNQHKIGGIYGHAKGDIIDILSTGTVDTNSYSLQHVGGLGGLLEGNVKRARSQVDVKVYGLKDQFVGNLVGTNNGRIEYSIGLKQIKIRSNGTTYVAGIAGYNNGFIYASYFTSNVSNESSLAYTGSIAGYNRGSIEQTFAFGNVYSKTHFKDTVYAGGLVGVHNGNYVKSNFFYGNVTTLSANANGSFAGRMIGQVLNSAAYQKNYVSTESTINRTSTEVISSFDTYLYAQVKPLTDIQTEYFIFTTLGWNRDTWGIRNGVPYLLWTDNI